MLSESSPRPALTVALCFLVALIEGIDLQAAGIAAPQMAKEFGMGPGGMGWIFSAALLGLLPGAYVGGRLADRWCAKPVLIGSVMLFGLFSLVTTHAGGYPGLLVARLMTGLGLGAALPLIIAVVANAVSEGQRGSMVTLTYAGAPLGGALAAWIGMSSLGDSWRLIFYLGGAAPLILVAALAYGLPSTKGSSVRPFNRSVLPTSGGGLLTNGRALSTVLLWLACFFTLTVLYMLMNWLPTLLVSQGYSRPQAGWVQILFNIGGACGSCVIGRMMDRGYTRLAVSITYLGMLASLAGLGLAPFFEMLLLAGFTAGYCAIGGQALLYALSPTLYPQFIRATGVGAAVAIGRLGSVAGPLVAGMVLAAGGGATALLLAATPGLLVAAGAAGMLSGRSVAYREYSQGGSKPSSPVWSSWRNR